MPFIKKATSLTILKTKEKTNRSLKMDSTESLKSTVDPVCGMSVNPETTNITATVEGHHYYFCAEGCRKAFVKNPHKFIDSECAKPKSWWGRYIARLNKATGGKEMKCH